MSVGPRESVASGVARVSCNRLSAHDATFLYAETSTTSMNVGAVFVLAPSTNGVGPLTLARLNGLVSRNIHLVPRLRQRLLTVPLNADFPVWVDDPAFSLDNHVRPAGLPAQASWPAVLTRMASLQAEPLPRDRPLWGMFLAEQIADGTTVLLLCAHHAMVDGMSGIRLVQAIFGVPSGTGAEEDRAAAIVPAAPWRPAPLPSRTRLLAATLTRRPDRSSHRTRPRYNRAAPLGMVRRAVPFLGLSPPRRGPFNVPVGRQRQLITYALPSAQARQLASRLGGTGHDLALTIVAGAIGLLLRRRGQRRSRASRTLRTVIPVARAVPGRHVRLGNHAAFSVVDLPVGTMSEPARFRLIRQATGSAKTAEQVQAISSFIRAGERVPAALYAFAVPLLARTSSANLVVSFMRGPRQSLDIGGIGLLAAYPSLPLGRRLALLVGVLDMGATVGFSFTADPQAVPDAGILAAACAEVVRDLLAQSNH